MQEAVPGALEFSPLARRVLEMNTRWNRPVHLVPFYGAEQLLLTPVIAS